MQYEVITHDGSSEVVTVESFDATGFNELLNNAEINTVELGGVIFARIDVKRVRPVEVTVNDGAE
jgi:hypothetical protein